MDTQIFNIGDGQISFEGDKILISDKAIRRKRLQLLTSFLWTFYGVISVLRYFKTKDEFLLWTGLLIGTGHFILFVIRVLRSTKNEIVKNDISSINFKSRFGNRFLDIRLKNGRLRRVSKIDGISSDLQLYIDNKFNLRA